MQSNAAGEILLSPYFGLYSKQKPLNQLLQGKLLRQVVARLNHGSPFVRHNIPYSAQQGAGAEQEPGPPVSSRPRRRILTGHRSEHVWDENLHQGLVQDVIAASHPFEDGFVFAQSDQLMFWESAFVLFIAVGGGGRRQC